MSWLNGNPEETFGRIGQAAVYLLPLLGVIGVLATAIAGLGNYLILSSYLVIPMLLAPAVYKIMRDRKEHGAGNPSPGMFRLLLITYLLCFALAIIILTAAEVRPPAYFLLIVTLSVVILLQIIGSPITKERTAIILLQIGGLMLNLNWGVTLKYFRFIGRTDILIHTQYLASVIQTGHVTEIFYDYQAFPLWHILNAALYMAGSGAFTPDKVMAIASGLAFLCLPVIVYLLTLRLFKNPKLALIAALLSVFYPDMAYFSMSGISRSIASLLFVFLLYLLLDENKHNRNSLLLVGLVTAAIIVYHSVSIIFVLLILLAIYILQKLLVPREKQFRRITLKYIAATALATLAYWAVFGQVLLLELYHNIIFSPPSGMITKSIINTPVAEAFNYLQYLPAVLFVFAGLLTVLPSKKYGAGAKIVSLVAFLFMWATFPGPQYLINKLMLNFGIDRFAEYTYPLLIIVSAAGLGALFYRSNKYVRAGLILLFAIWVMLSVSNDWVASDNPLVKRPFYTYYLTEKETSAFDLIAASTDSLILSDFVTDRYIDSAHEDRQFDMLEVSNDSRRLYTNSPSDVLIVRNGELQKRPLKLSINDLGVYDRYQRVDTYNYYYADSPVWEDFKNYDRVFDSASVSAYL